jgi:diaminohydroxyphosphoribosylaminopyrimidine deaminase/5-amino-6-(5-phosphoribosylamino)uracil reductase
MTTSYMAEALAEAAKGAGQTSPNPTVGAIVVRDGQIVGRGYHVWSRMSHAEVEALQEAGDKAHGATVYVTLEPCAHQGRTGPCANALIQAGVARVVAAMEDPNPLVSGRGFAKLRDAGIEVELDAEAKPTAEKLNQAFVHFMRSGLPLVTLKSALTLDGKIAAPQDNSGWITSEKARAHVQELRHRSDAILTGIGTVLADDCLLTDRSGEPRSRPLLRIVVDSQLRLPTSSQMVSSAANDVAVVTTSAAPDQRRRALEARGIEVLTFDGPTGRTDFGMIAQWLASQKYQSLMIEAGSKVNWSALDSGVVDRIFFYYAPKILGGLQSLPVAGGAGKQRRADAMRFRDVTLHNIAGDEFAVEGWLIK